MKRILFLIAALSLGLAAKAQTEADSIVLCDTLSEDMPTSTSYTLSLKNFQLADANSEAILRVRIGDNATGADIHFTANQIYMENGSDTLVLADSIPDGLAAHDYVVIRQARIYLYRDGVNLGRNNTANYKDGARIVLVNPSAVVEGYTFEVTDPSGREVPDEADYETNIDNMLSEISDDNLSPDPYLNSGLDRTGSYASNRGYTTANTANAGYGSAIYVDTENAYSGPMAIRLEGQAYLGDSEETTTGASLVQAIDFTANYPYVVRAMVKSDGWTGGIYIYTEDNFLPITDTGGEWEQVEAVLIPSSSWSSSSYETFTVCNEDYDSDGTLLIDNIEVYKGLTGTSISSATYVASANVAAKTNWTPSHSVTAWRLGMNETSSEVFSQIDTSLVTVAGAPYFSRAFEGSTPYALYLPNGITSIVADGTWDYRSHTGYHLYHGLDYICQQMDPATGTFSYLDDDADLEGGLYIFQFADNYEDVDIRFDLNPSKAAPTPSADDAFQAYGNAELFAHSVSTDDASATLLFFDEDNHLFSTSGSTNSNAEALRPFMPYILNTTGQTTIELDGSTGIQRLQAAQTGENILVRAATGGIVLTARANADLNVYSVSGMRIAQTTVSSGDNYLALPAGLYIVAGKKVLVR